MSIEKPNVKTIFKIGDFKLIVYAYRKLTISEGEFALRHWLNQKGLKQVPQKGYAKLITTFGHNLE